ncbi:MAG: hypothetical protein KKA65_04945 [Nanoarchaeota archaeon]|nr:hypothetical protein [Nanoarchaeota archaeon]MCG2719580.1 hypothetical protein [Nanoarchaeota archaeon]
MIKLSEYNRVKRLIGKGIIVYVDPANTPDFHNFYLDTLPLLTDKALCFCNQKSDFSERMCQFITEGFILPVVIDDTILPSEILESGNYIARKNIFQETFFQQSYSSLVENNRKDKKFRWMVSKILKPNNTDLYNAVDNLSLTIAWDTIFSQTFDVPMILNPQYLQLWFYHLRKLGLLYSPPNPMLKHTLEVGTFLNDVNIMLPKGLPIDKINIFRADPLRTHFTNFLENTIHKAQLTNEDFTADVSSNLVNDFNKLAQKYKKYADVNKTLSPIVGALFGGIVGSNLGSMGGTILGSASGATMAGILDKVPNLLFNKFNRRRWIFLIQNPV